MKKTQAKQIVLDLGAQQKALYHLSLAINGSENLSEILKIAVEQTRIVLGCEDASIVLWDPDIKQFSVGSSTTSIGEKVAFRVRRSGGASRWIIEHCRPFLVPDTTRDPFTANAMIPEGGVRAYIGVPILHRNKPLGVMYALFKTEREFHNRETESLHEIANMAALAIQNASLVASLRELNSFKDNLMQLAAHDIRSPLGLVKGYVDLLVSELPPQTAEQISWIEVIDRSLTRIDELVIDILDYGRLTTSSEFEFNRLDTRDLVQQMVIDFGDIAVKNKQVLSYETGPEPLPVQGDKILLRQALGNLVSNALKYTPAGGEISIFTWLEESNIVLAVRDNGPGIQENERDALFQPFRRLTTSRGTPGSGLGLNLTQIIIERHGGSITLESEAGQGSLFSIYLPAAE